MQTSAPFHEASMSAEVPVLLAPVRDHPSSIEAASESILETSLLTANGKGHPLIDVVVHGKIVIEIGSETTLISPATAKFLGALIEPLQC